MRERSQTTSRRRSGPKQPLPPPRDDAYDPYSYDAGASESPYYTIDNTEDIYGTTLLPSQRCYVDPWDLENYDYVRKKQDSSVPSPSDDYYETSLTPSPAGEPVATRYYYAPQTPPPSPPRLASTLPRNRRKSSSHLKCELECCVTPAPVPQRRRSGYDEKPTRGSGGGGSGLYGVGGAGRAGKYEDYMMNMAAHMQNEDEEREQNIYTGYGGFSSASSNERHSSIGDECVSTLLLHTPGFGGAITRKRGLVLPKPAPKLDFPPAPPSLPPAYDYCNPYATLPYCSVSDCYECLSQSQQNGGGGGGVSLIYAAPSAATIYGGGDSGGDYGSSSVYGVSGLQSSSSTLARPSRRSSSSLYGGIYAHKFGMSKKGLLQIDYSCSWNDLDRVIGRNY